MLKFTNVEEMEREIPQLEVDTLSFETTTTMYEHENWAESFPLDFKEMKNRLGPRFLINIKYHDANKPSAKLSKNVNVMFTGKTMLYDTPWSPHNPTTSMTVISHDDIYKLVIKDVLADANDSVIVDHVKMIMQDHDGLVESVCVSGSGNQLIVTGSTLSVSQLD